MTVVARDSFKCNKGCQLFVSSNDESFSAIAVRVVPGQITTPWIKDQKREA